MLNQTNLLNYIYLSSRSSSPNASRYTDPQRHARLPRITTTELEVTTKNMPVPPPHSNEC